MRAVTFRARYAARAQSLLSGRAEHRADRRDGSGKSSVSRLLADHGAVIIDADVIAREVVEPGTPGLAAVVEAFGREVLTADGVAGRPALAKVVFGDPEARARLDGIVHPLVRARGGELAAGAAPDAVVVHDVPLLAETGQAASYDLGDRGGRSRDPGRPARPARADGRGRRDRAPARCGPGARSFVAGPAHPTAVLVETTCRCSWRRGTGRLPTTWCWSCEAGSAGDPSGEARPARADGLADERRPGVGRAGRGDEQHREVADVVLDNSGTTAQLEAQVERFWAERVAPALD